MLNVLKNIIYLHSKTISNSCSLMIEIEKSINSLEPFTKRILNTMLTNIKNNRSNIFYTDLNLLLDNKPPISAEDRIILEKQCTSVVKLNSKFKKIIKPFKEGEIVGAKDKENKWWLSRVLHVFQHKDSENYWYYIRFEGWSSLHDEWINSKTFRVRAFNSKKHFLKRSS